MNLDFSFFTWNVVSNFVLKGLVFSVQLTLVAMVGGIVLGTVLALMRLSGKPWLVVPAAGYVNTMRDAVSAGDRIGRVELHIDVERTRRGQRPDGR